MTAHRQKRNILAAVCPMLQPARYAARPSRWRYAPLTHEAPRVSPPLPRPSRRPRPLLPGACAYSASTARRPTAPCAPGVSPPAVWYMAPRCKSSTRLPNVCSPGLRRVRTSLREAHESLPALAIAPRAPCATEPTCTSAFFRCWTRTSATFALYPSGHHAHSGWLWPAVVREERGGRVAWR